MSLPKGYAASNQSYPVIYLLDGEAFFTYTAALFYVFDLPINSYGIYNMIGNVAELVKEKGIVKGGSYLDNIHDCSIDRKGEYMGASTTVGFRTVCEIKYVD